MNQARRVARCYPLTVAYVALIFVLVLAIVIGRVVTA